MLKCVLAQVVTLCTESALMTSAGYLATPHLGLPDTWKVHHNHRHFQSFQGR